MSRAAAVDLRWCDRPHGSASFLFFDPTGLSHQTCYRRFHELAMDQTAIDEELRGLSRPKASKSRIDIEERGAAAQYLGHGLRSRRSWAGMSRGPSRGGGISRAFGRGRGRASRSRRSAGALAWRQAYLPRRAVKPATSGLTALTARLNQCGKGSPSTNGKLGLEGPDSPVRG